ncbi:unnamed protein product [Caenorhabditis brenneri]
MSQSESVQSSESTEATDTINETKEKRSQPVEEEKEEPKQLQPNCSRQTSHIQDVVASLHDVTLQMEEQKMDYLDTTAAHKTEIQEFINKLKADATSPPTTALFRECVYAATDRNKYHEEIQSSLFAKIDDATERIASSISRLQLQFEEVNATHLQYEKMLQAREEEYKAEIQKKTAEKEEKWQRAEARRRSDAESHAKNMKKKEEAALQLQKKQQAVQAQANKERKAANREAYKEAKAAKEMMERFKFNSRINYSSAIARAAMDNNIIREPPSTAASIASSSTKKRVGSPISITMSTSTSEGQPKRRPLSERTQFVMTLPKKLPHATAAKKAKKNTENIQ